MLNIKRFSLDTEKSEDPDQLIPDIPQEDTKVTVREIRQYSGRPVPLKEYTMDITTAAMSHPYCPVYPSQTPSGEMYITAYLTGMVEDLNEYYNLVDCIELMSEGDLLDIYIDSPGGYLATGAVVASCIDSCKGKVRGIARGLCASAGSLIWTACHECYAYDTANFMYHMSSHVDRGNSVCIKDRATEQVDYVRYQLLNEAVRKKHLTVTEYEQIVKGKKNIFIPGPEMQKRLVLSPTNS